MSFPPNQPYGNMPPQQGGYNQPPGGYNQPQYGSYPPQQQQQSSTMNLGGDDHIKLSVYPHLTPSQMINIASTFLAFDENKSGGIQKEEMLHCLNANGIQADPNQVADYVSRMDTDRDGQVSWTEYFKFMIDVFQGRAQGIMPR